MKKYNQIILVLLVTIIIACLVRIEENNNVENFQTRLSNMKAYYRRNKRQFFTNVFPDLNGYKDKALHFFRMKIN
jgi:hypothetical protein